MKFPAMYYALDIHRGQGGLMVLAASDMTGWWVGYIIGGVVVALVAALVLLITKTAHGIAVAAEDITRSLEESRIRTEALWEVATTNEVASAILSGAIEARRALGGGGNDEGKKSAGDHAHEADHMGESGSRRALKPLLQQGPQLNPEEGS